MEALERKFSLLQAVRSKISPLAGTGEKNLLAGYEEQNFPLALTGESQSADSTGGF